jgi:hypothetical protein
MGDHEEMVALQVLQPLDDVHAAASAEPNLVAGM